MPHAPASYTQTREGGWGAGTAVPDTAASYPVPPTHINCKPVREACLRTTVHGSRKERECGHGRARLSGMIHSTERG